jgi:L-seryl-tRNA(Ser) seleniumtransferase
VTDATDPYADVGVPTVINGAGTKTRVGGTLMREEAVAAMAAAAESFARISDLQAAACDRIAAATGAEAGYVTSGANAALTMAAAACIAGDDLGVMDRLPETPGVADEIVVPRSHRTGYDHALRAAGATMVDVGANDRQRGTGAVNVQPWQIDDAIGEDTAAVAYLAKPDTAPPLERVCEVAHAREVPVIVDAAAQLPPTRNLERFVAEGADLVAFSGGKAIRGPQSTGLLAGRSDLVRSVALQHLDMHAAAAAWDPPETLFDVDDLPGVPTQGLGRSFKIGKEELVAVLAALEAFLAEDDEATLAAWHDRAEFVADELGDLPGLSATLVDADKTAVVTSVLATVDEDTAGIETTDLVRDLRRENPRVFVGGDELPAPRFTVNPRCLSDDEAATLVRRVAAALERGG